MNINTSKYRPLTLDEISTLTARGCTATNWNSIQVTTEGFNASRVTNVEFSGSIKIGKLEGTFEREGGLIRNSQITNTTLHNVTIGNNVMIRNVANYIANYDICDNSYIDNINCLVGTLNSSFGIGTDVSVLNETGGREVPIYENMSAQTAYMIAMYRHDNAMVESLVSMIKNHAESLKGKRGRVGINSEITNCGTITDIMIGDYAKIKGATRLRDGFIANSSIDPVMVGRDVIAEGFVFASGSRVDDGAVVHHCFVGQASILSHLFRPTIRYFLPIATARTGKPQLFLEVRIQ